jgi:PAS domain S-box-containing protein
MSDTFHTYLRRVINLSGWHIDAHTTGYGNHFLRSDMEARGKNEKPDIENGADLSLGRKSTIPLSRFQELSRERLSYLRLLYFLILSIFLAEVMAMIVAYFLPPLPYIYVTLIDAGIMTILIFPMLYYLSFQPLVRHLQIRRRIQDALEEKEELQERFFNNIDLLIAYMDRDFNFIGVNDAYARNDGQTPHYFVGKNHFQLYPHPENEQIFRHVVETGEHFSAHAKPFSYSNKPGRVVTFWDWSLQAVKGPDGVVEGLVLSLLDVTQRKQAEEKLEQRNKELQIISTAERTQRQFSDALIEAALIVNRSLKLNEVLSLILEQIRGAIPFQLGDIIFLEGDSFYNASHLGELEWPVSRENSGDRFQLEKFPLLNRICQSGKPVLIPDTREELAWMSPDGFAWVRSCLSAPLLVESKVIGFVNLFSDQPGYFTQQMSDRLVAFAAHAAVAIQNAWLFEQVQASTERLQSLSRRLVEVQENERLYISRELHDEAGQVLTSLLVDLRLLEKHSSQPDIILKIIAEMEQALNGVIQNLHRMAIALRPASLDHVGLVAALQQHLEAVGDKHSIQSRFRSSGVIERLPANVETILYRTVQEALTNVVRHAQATRVDVVLTVREGKLVLLVEDDGVGFDPSLISTEDHLGLFGIRERAEMIGATLVVESEPGKGTTIMMEVGYADSVASRR